MTEIDDLESGASALGAALDADQLEQLLKLAALLKRWNRAFNLISRRDVARLIPRHLLDALSLVPFVRGARVLDLGTGAGLPGLPLAIACPSIQFELVDRNQRRIRFVRQAVFELGLTNVDAAATDFVRFRPTGLFDTVVSRAVAAPSMLWRVAAPLLVSGGQALFLVGTRDDEFAPDSTCVERIDIHVPGLTSVHRLLRVTRRSVATEGDQ